jgi:maltooligosyltrehalose trehalohydrolase
MVGAHYSDQGNCSFIVWAPEKDRVILHLLDPDDRKIAMTSDRFGYHRAEIKNVKPGTRYFYQPDGKKDLPDPASFYQPEGVHGPSAVVDHHQYQWHDHQWKGMPFCDLILYELHVGTFTDEGTFEAIIPRLKELKAIGINGIELMPVAQFPGNRNWGYDAVYPYAVQHSYGGPNGLKKLVDACHQHGMAVFLDVVYNHLGPEGNYFSKYAPYFTHKYGTPWGDALNFDGDYSDGVREYFSDNPIYWFKYFHIDGLRVDAIHMVFDSGAVNFWELTHAKINQLQQKTGRPLYTIAESDLNSPKVVRSPEVGGFGFTAQWLDDFHHALYVLLDKKGKDRYADFGLMEQLAKAYTDGFVHSGEYVTFRKRKHGVSSAGISGDKFVIFNLNHDQVGNRVRGERLCVLVDKERLKLASAAIFLSPYIPMLFMGEEYADESPFYYFVSHSDEALIKAVREGRKKEFENYKWDVEPPDPQAEKTFIDSKLSWTKKHTGKHLEILEWHKQLIELRTSHPALRNFNKNDVRAYVIGQDGLVLHRVGENGLQHLFCMFNFSEKEIAFQLPKVANAWTKILSSKAGSDNNLPSGSTISILPLSICVYEGSSVEAAG